MMRKFLILSALTALINAGLQASTAEAAQAVAVTSPQAAAALPPGYYWISVCSSASPVDCPPTGVHAFWFGPYATLALCLQSRNLAGIFATFPWSASSCFPQ